MLNRLLLSYSLLLVTISANAQSPQIWGSLKKGDYEVGFDVIYDFDYSRVYHNPHPVTGTPFPGETARPIRTFIWYPASVHAATLKMKYQDYIFVKPEDKKFESFNMALADYDYWATIHWTNQRDSSKNKLLNFPVEAHLKAKPLAKKFPLIVHFLGLNDRRNENIPLWEYLASHGYVVITIPQFSGGGDVSMELWGFSALGKETQVRDMEFAMSKLRDSPNIDFQHIGVIGYSYGSVFALRLAMFNSNIKALVTFDGNINNKNGQMVIESFYNPKIKVDWLNIHRAKYEALDLKVFETLKYTNRYRITYANANHGDFEDFAIVSSLMPGQVPEYALKDRTAAVGKKNYETTCVLTLDLFDKSLKGSSSSMNDFESLVTERKKEGIIMETDYRSARKVMDEEDLANIIIYYGIPEAERIYNNVRNDKEYDILITSEDLLGMAKALRMGGRRLDKSNDVLLFMKSNFPQNINVQLELARNYIELKDLTAARSVLDEASLIDNKNKEVLELLKLTASK